MIAINKGNFELTSFNLKYGYTLPTAGGRRVTSEWYEEQTAVLHIGEAKINKASHTWMLSVLLLFNTHVKANKYGAKACGWCSPTFRK